MLGGVYCALGLILLNSLMIAPQNPSQSLPVSFQLSSWQDSNGVWNFCIVPGDVFEQRCNLQGLQQLEKRIFAPSTD